jgi:hypothetical protein
MTEEERAELLAEPRSLAWRCWDWILIVTCFAAGLAVVMGIMWTINFLIGWLFGAFAAFMWALYLIWLPVIRGDRKAR